MSKQNSTTSRRSNGRHPARARVSARRHLGRCAVSGKVRFRDKREALEAVHAACTIRRFAEADGSTTTRQERRTYRCSGCNGWHLTSQEFRAEVSHARSRGPARDRTDDPIDKASGPRSVFLAIHKPRKMDITLLDEPVTSSFHQLDVQSRRVNSATE
jgi:hypothetical protein